MLKESLKYPIEDEKSTKTLVFVGVFYLLTTLIAKRFLTPWGNIALVLYPISMIPIVGYGITVLKHLHSQQDDEKNTVPTFGGVATAKEGIKGVLIWSWYVFLVTLLVLFPAVLLYNVYGDERITVSAVIFGALFVLIFGEASMIRYAHTTKMLTSINPLRLTKILGHNLYIRACLVSIVIVPIMNANPIVSALHTQVSEYNSFILSPVLAAAIGLYGYLVILHQLSQAMVAVYPEDVEPVVDEKSSEQVGAPQ